MNPEPENLKDGLSNKVKASIIILTFFTLCAFGALLIKIVYSVSSNDNKDNYQYLLDVGDKLKNNGLKEQAISEYIRYLDQAKKDTPPYFSVSHKVGELYMELNNCREALVWLFHAENLGSSYQRAEELKSHIDVCLTQINSSKPENLTTR